MHRLPNKTLDSQYLHCSKLNEKIDNVIVNFGYFVYLKKLNCGEQLWSPCTKLVQSLHAILLEAATLVLLNEIRRVETQIACRTGWVTVGPAEQLLKCGGRGGGGLDGLLIYRKLIVVANIKFICYVGKANLSVLSLRLIELSR